ncbi:hypothetical protein M747DRAFT_123376 [Aspergillus niger ATCC 13496]|uniref:Zn(2)-C6 fungal-type domain-containing protein n=1 Tax=Aspergillus niger ATCC 13496 TaxID=1353008 RepID=A0A370BKG9_ASPNG|nr:hypothetical protein M747DRAFT_123376 [Aspergillus niger ATCC 13496]
MMDSFIFVTDMGQSGQTDRRQKPKLKRRRGACDSCRQRKVRCNGDQPCNQCQRCSLGCHYRSLGRQRRLSSAACSDPTVMEGPPVHPESIPAPASTRNMRPIHPSNSEPALEVIDNSHQLPPEASHNQFTTMAEFEGDWDWESLLMYSNQEEDAHVTSSPMGSTAETAFAPFEPAGVRSDAGPSLSFDGTRYREDKPTGFTADLVALQSRSLGHSITGKLHSLVLEEDIDMSRPQRAKLIQVLDRLAAGRFRLLHGESHGNTSSEKSEEGTENYSREFAYKCIDASYVDPQGVPTLLDREDLERLIDRVMDKAAVFPAGLTLLNAILAIGSHCLNLKDSTSSASRANYPVSQFFDKALKFRHQIPAEASLEKLQSLLVMSYFASRTGSILASSLIAEATCCAQGLRLNSTPAIQRTHAGPIEQETARRAFWFLYCLEKPHCLREGTFPLVNEAFIDHTPPRLLNSFGKSDWLLINSRYAGLCSRILRRLYGGGSCCCEGECSDTVDSIEILERALKAWGKELPFPCDTPPSNRMMNYSTLTCTDRRLRLSNLYRYHGAVIAIQILQSCQSNTQWDEEICCQSARTILSACYCISLSDVQYDWSLYYFPSIATCVLFIILIRKGNSQKDLSYIGIASGFFGRLSLDADVPFDEITELIKFAQQHLKDGCIGK